MDRVYSLSSGQSDLLLEHQLYPSDSYNHFHFVARVRDINPSKFEQALISLQRKYDVLRTYYTISDSKPRRKILAEGELKFFIKEALSLNQKELKQEIIKQYKKSFKLECSPPFLFLLYRRSDEEYVLQIVAHHIAVSLEGFYRILIELVRLYKGIEDASSFEKKKSYSNFLKEISSSSSNKNTLIDNFFTSPLSPQNLPGNIKKGKKHQQYSLATFHFDFKENQVANLKQISSRYSNSFFSIITSAFQILLNKFTQTEDSIVGIPLDVKKAFSGYSHLFDNTTNTLPIRTPLSGEMNIIDVIQSVGHDIKGLSKSRTFPSNKILKKTKVSSVKDLFSTLVVSHTFSEHDNLLLFGLEKKGEVADIEGIKFESIGLGAIPTGRFDLTLALAKTDKGYVLSFRYNQAIYQSSVIKQLADSYLCLLDIIINNPTAKLKSISIVSDKEINLQLNTWNQTDDPSLTNKNIIQHFETACRDKPDAIALISKEKQLTFSQLNSQANHFAHMLLDQGLKGANVAFLLERSTDFISCMLGVLKAGCYFLPIDPTLPSNRIDFILQDSGAKLLITEEKFKKKNCTFKGQVIFLSRYQHSIKKKWSINTKTTVTSDALAYLIYTSGSTGKPKGVEISQRSLANLLFSMQKELRFTAKERWLALTTFSFDISILEILLPLISGSTLVLATQTEIKDPLLIANAIAKYHITYAQATPATWQMLIETGWAGNANLNLLCGGESLPKALAEKITPKCRALWNMYGPTETTIWSSMKKVNPKKHVTIGKPIANTKFFVLDENHFLLPIGVIGELYIGGEGLAVGYRNQFSLTQEKFQNVNINRKWRERLYKTGDLVRYLQNGEVEYIGRVDHQVKIRGFRIELEEIEEAIKQCPKVKNAIVLTNEDAKGKNLVAFFSGKANQKAIQSKLESLLPSYMIPAHYVSCGQFPLNANGKIDRKILAQTKFTPDKIKPASLANNIEKQLAEIFQEILSLEQVGSNTDFFREGGHSLLAAQVIYKINKQFNVELPLSTIFKNRTIRRLANKIAQSAPTTKILTSAKLAQRKCFDLSFSQKYFWFLSQEKGSNVNYSVPFIIEFKGNLHLSTLRKALNSIVIRHQCLRANFQEDTDGVTQRFSEHVDLKIPLLNLESCEDGLKISKEEIYKEATKPFDLNSGPLFRFKVYKITHDHYFLFSNFHHIIFDGYSQNIFLQELKLLYESYLLKTTSKLQELTFQYSDLIQREQILNNEKEKIDWWSQNLQDTSNQLLLPTDHPTSVPKGNEGRTYQFYVSKKDYLALKKYAQDQKSTLFSVLLAIFYTLLFRYTGQEDITIGIPIANRHDTAFASLIGCFMNILPFRIPANLRKKFSSLLAAIQKHVLQILDNQLPFEKILSNLTFARSHNHSSLYQVIFNLLPPESVTKISDLVVSVQDVDKKTSHLDLSLTFQETSEGLVGFFEYRSDLFLKRTISRMTKHFVQLVKEIIHDPNQEISQFQILTDKEVQKQTLDWNLQAISYNTETSILEQFDKWVESTPDNIALICRGKKYTYYEVQSHANKIANALLEEGVQPGHLVPVYLERSVEFIFSILGILKAGAAYIPIDPQEPKNRILEKLHDLNPFVILTTEKMDETFYPFKAFHLEETLAASPVKPDIKFSFNQLAYIIFTSGTSGKPKGVEIDHKSINDRVMWKINAYPLTSKDRVLHTYSLIFDGAIINYFWPLCSGSTLVLTTGTEQIDSEQLINLIHEHQITTMDMLPSLLESLLEEKEFSTCHSLRHVFVGGEPLKREIIHRFYQINSASLHNTYGPTETTVEATNWTCDPSFKGSTVPIGKPIAGAKVYILDQSHNLVPPGVIGELFIGGVGVAKGYLNDPGLTEKKFLKNPFCKDPSEKIYATGDLVKYQPDGCIEFLGRIDDQVKIRGYRIDTKEIESHLLHMNLVDQAIVLAKDDGISAMLVAYVILTPTMSADSFTILMHNYLKQIVPQYMIPSQVVVMKKFPALLNGKIDYNGLPVPRKKTTKKPSACLNKSQPAFLKQIIRIWQEILQLKEINPDDNFFNIGGHSLSAMRLITKIKYTMNKIVPITVLFRYPTPSELAAWMENENPQNLWSPLVPIQPEGEAEPFFCVHPIGGNVCCYNTLAKQIKTDTPFYGLQARGLEEGQTPHASIQDMAAEYVNAIKEIQPHGPYLLGGWSFGGIVAIEMAHQLIKQGDKISNIILLDSTAHIERFKKLPVNDDSQLLKELISHYVSDFSTKQSPRSLKEQFVNFIQNGNLRGKPDEKNLSARIIALAKANYNALKNYSIPSIPIEITLLRAENNPEIETDLGWKKYVKKVSIHINPGDHWAITRDTYASFWANDIMNVFQFFSKKPQKRIKHKLASTV